MTFYPLSCNFVEENMFGGFVDFVDGYEKFVNNISDRIVQV